MGTNYYLQRVAGREVFDEWPVADLDSAYGVRFHPVFKRVAEDFYGSYPDDPPSVELSADDLENILCCGEYSLVAVGHLDDPRFALAATSREIFDGLAAAAVPFSTTGSTARPVPAVVLSPPSRLSSASLWRTLSGEFNRAAWPWRTIVRA